MKLSKRQKEELIVKGSIIAISLLMILWLINRA